MKLQKLQAPKTKYQMVRQAVRQAHGPEQRRTIWNLELVIWDLRFSETNDLYPSAGTIARKNAASA